MSDLEAIPDFKTLVVSNLQVIANLRIPLAISSSVSIFFKSFVPACRILNIMEILHDYWNDVGFHVFKFCPMILGVRFSNF